MALSLMNNFGDMDYVDNYFDCNYYIECNYSNLIYHYFAFNKNPFYYFYYY